MNLVVPMSPEDSIACYSGGTSVSSISMDLDMTEDVLTEEISNLQQRGYDSIAIADQGMDGYKQNTLSPIKQASVARQEHRQQ